jgi:hypothetical protein
MNEKLIKYLGSKSVNFLNVVNFSLVILIGFIDYHTGYELSFSIFYLIPVTFSVWFVKKYAGILMSVASAMTWLVTDLQAGHQYSHIFIPYWNAIVRMGFFLVATFTLDALKASQERKESLITDLKAALSKVKMLEGILPVCSFCKKIRDEDNTWSTMEGYISSHSEALFSHTYCPDCAREHYPEYFKQKHQKQK